MGRRLSGAGGGGTGRRLDEADGDGRLGSGEEDLLFGLSFLLRWLGAWRRESVRDGWWGGFLRRRVVG